MKKEFKRPVVETVYFKHNDIVTISCSCFVSGIVFDSDETCTGANVECTCNPNSDDPSANCV